MQMPVIILVSLLIATWLALPVALFFKLRGIKRKYRMDVDVHRQVIDHFKEYNADVALTVLRAISEERDGLVPIDTMVPKARMVDDLELDDFTFFYIGLCLKEELGIMIDPDKIAEFDCLGDLILEAGSTVRAKSKREELY